MISLYKNIEGCKRGITSAPLGDCFSGDILGIFSEKIFKKAFKIF
jgi:hypothetical protein